MMIFNLLIVSLLDVDLRLGNQLLVMSSVSGHVLRFFITMFNFGFDIQSREISKEHIIVTSLCLKTRVCISMEFVDFLEETYYKVRKMETRRRDTRQNNAYLFSYKKSRKNMKYLPPKHSPLISLNLSFFLKHMKDFCKLMFSYVSFFSC
jgi:hypothetical protein